MPDYPELYTERLRLGRIRISDIPKLVEYANNPNVSDNTLNLPHPYTEEDAINWIDTKMIGIENKDVYIFSIFLKKQDEFIGEIGLHLDKEHNRAELGYWLAESFWNKGIMSEAAKEVIQFGFDYIKLNKIYATHLLSNIGSEMVLKKAGMIKEADLKEHYLKNGKYVDIRQYYLTKSEFERIENAII